VFVPEDQEAETSADDGAIASSAQFYILSISLHRRVHGTSEDPSPFQDRPARRTLRCILEAGFTGPACFRPVDFVVSAPAVRPFIWSGRFFLILLCDPLLSHLDLCSGSIANSLPAATTALLQAIELFQSSAGLLWVLEQGHPDKDCEVTSVLAPGLGGCGEARLAFEAEDKAEASHLLDGPPTAPCWPLPCRFRSRGEHTHALLTGGMRRSRVL
jgi:hypothetical protein